jgi:3-(3-hydroxy-phenyl)propionate hydroxylase
LAALRVLETAAIPVKPLVITRQAGTMDGVAVLHDIQGLFAKRYDAQPGSVWLARPDQHVVARWRHFNSAAVQAALRRATANV